MSKPLDRLVGMELNAVEASPESIGLIFAGCVFSAYSKHSATQPLANLVGHTVQSVSYRAEESLAINFLPGMSFSVSLKPIDYMGPEAFAARFTDGPWVIE